MADRFRVDDDIKWGKLVKSWATGRNYFDQTKPAPALPRTLDELKQQCSAIGLSVTIPALHKGLAIVQYSAEVLAIKLPPKSMVDDAETELGRGGDYEFPRMYNDFYTRYGTPLRLPDLPSKMDFHAARIGEYSIGNCA
jgi:hypothetical protein